MSEQPTIIDGVTIAPITDPEAHVNVDAIREVLSGNLMAIFDAFEWQCAPQGPLWWEYQVEDDELVPAARAILEATLAHHENPPAKEPRDD